MYSDAIEQLQAEQDGLEAENAKLRNGQGPDAKTGHSSNTGPLGEAFTLPGGGLEVSQLAEQVSVGDEWVLRHRLMSRLKIYAPQYGSCGLKMLYSNPDTYTQILVHSNRLLTSPLSVELERMMPTPLCRHYRLPHLRPQHQTRPPYSRPSHPQHDNHWRPSPGCSSGISQSIRPNRVSWIYRT